MARVYTSATCPDLIQHRWQANLILSWIGHEDVSHGFYLRQSHTGAAERAERIKASHIYAGIFAWSRGPGPDGRAQPAVSFTEMEYGEALSARKPCLIFLLSESALWLPNLMDDDRRAINEFRARLERHHPYYFQTLEEFGRLFYDALALWGAANGLPPPPALVTLESLRGLGRGRSRGNPAATAAAQERGAHPLAPRPSVFVSYAREDEPRARELCRRLEENGLRPWMDKEKLLPGEHWERELRRAMRESDFVALCLSRTAVSKTGFVQKEFRLALEVAREKPLGSIFLFPVRLDDCPVPDELAEYQSVELSSPKGFEMILRAVRKEMGRRGGAPAGS